MNKIIRRCEYFGMTLQLGNSIVSVVAGKDFNERLAQAEQELLKKERKNAR